MKRELLLLWATCTIAASFVGCNKEEVVEDPYIEATLREATFGEVISEDFLYKIVNPEVIDGLEDILVVKQQNLTQFFTGNGIVAKMDSLTDKSNVTFRVLKSFSPIVHFEVQNVVSAKDSVVIPQDKPIAFPRTQDAMGFAPPDDYEEVDMSAFRWNDTEGLRAMIGKKYDIRAKVHYEAADTAWVLEGYEASAWGEVPKLRMKGLGRRDGVQDLVVPCLETAEEDGHARVALRAQQHPGLRGVDAAFGVQDDLLLPPQSGVGEDVRERDPGDDGGTRDGRVARVDDGQPHLDALHRPSLTGGQAACGEAERDRVDATGAEHGCRVVRVGGGRRRPDHARRCPGRRPGVVGTAHRRAGDDDPRSDPPGHARAVPAELDVRRHGVGRLGSAGPVEQGVERHRGGGRGDERGLLALGPGGDPQAPGDHLAGDPRVARRARPHADGRGRVEGPDRHRGDPGEDDGADRCGDGELDDGHPRVPSPADRATEQAAHAVTVRTTSVVAVVDRVAVTGASPPATLNVHVPAGRSTPAPPVTVAGSA